MKTEYPARAIKIIEENIKLFEAAGLPLAIAELAAIRTWQYKQYTKKSGCYPGYPGNPSANFEFASTPEPEFWDAVMLDRDYLRLWAYYRSQFVRLKTPQNIEAGR